MENKDEWLFVLGRSSDIILNLCVLVNDLDQKLCEDIYVALQNSFENQSSFGKDIDNLLKSSNSEQFKNKVSLLITKTDGIMHICNAINIEKFDISLIKNLVISIQNYLLELQSRINSISEL